MFQNRSCFKIRTLSNGKVSKAPANRNANRSTGKASSSPPEQSAGKDTRQDTSWGPMWNWPRGCHLHISVLGLCPSQGVFTAPAPQCPKPMLWKGREKRKEPPSPVSRWGWRPASISKACTGRLDVQEPSDGPGNSVRMAPWSKGLVVTPGIKKKPPKVQLVIPNC